MSSSLFLSTPRLGQRQRPAVRNKTAPPPNASPNLESSTAKMPDPATPLQAITRRAAKGEADAQRLLYHKLYPYAMSIALHYAGRREEAEEITQDAFVKLFRQLVKQAPSGSIKAYLSRIVINTSIDLLRKRKRQLFTEEIDEGTVVAAGNARNAGTDRLEEAEIYKLLQYLSPACRLVFNLHVLEGYSHPEIAKKLDISEGTSKSNLSKARKKLKALAIAYYQLKPTTDE